MIKKLLCLMFTGLLACALGCNDSSTKSDASHLKPTTQTAKPTTRSSPLSQKLIFPKKIVKAGGSLDGTLRIENSSKSSINLTKQCQPNWGVGLRNNKVIASAALITVCEMKPFWIHPGTNNFPVSISTAGQIVTEANYPGKALGFTTPPGKYQTDFESLGGDGITNPPPVDISVIS